MKRPSILVAGLLLVQGVLLAWSGYRHSPTIDEPAHLAAGISHWQSGLMDLYAVNPPLVRTLAAVPVLFADPEMRWESFRKVEEGRGEFKFGRAFANANGERIFWLTTLARWACIPLILVGGWVCWRWASELFGPASGVLALTLWCVSPNILAHGSLITADAASAAAALAAGYFFWHWLKERTSLNAVTAGVSLGVGLLVKSTLILFCGLWPMLWGLYRLAGREQWTWRPVRRELTQGTFLMATAILILNFGYGFEGTLRRLDSYAFVSEALAGSREGQTFQTFGNRFDNNALGALRAPVPANFLIGIDRQRRDFETGWSRFFRGEVRESDEPGWWWFYLYGAAVKVPLGTWLLVLLAVPLALTRPVRDQLPLLVPGLALLVLVSSQTGLNFFRYLLPAFGFAFVWMSQAAQHITEGRIWQRWLTIAAAGWMIASSLWVYPHSLSYFNELAGGPKQGFRLMADANADWGQDLLYLRDWVDEHPEARADLLLNYFGGVDPGIAGLGVSNSQHDRNGISQDAPDAANDPDSPQWYAVSVTRLVKSAANDRRDDDGHLWPPTVRARNLLSQEPDGRAGYSILIYRIGRR